MSSAPVAISKNLSNPVGVDASQSIAAPGRAPSPLPDRVVAQKATRRPKAPRADPRPFLKAPRRRLDSASSHLRYRVTASWPHRVWTPSRLTAAKGGPGSLSRRMDRRHIALLFTVGALALALAVVGIRGMSQTKTTAAEPVVSAPPSRFQGAQLPAGVRAPNFKLRDENGKRVTMREYRGKPVVVTFLYSHC